MTDVLTGGTYAALVGRQDVVAARWVPWLVAALPFVFAGVYLALGTGFVLDDWYLLRNAEFDGAWAAAGHDPGQARPGSIPVFALVFGAFGPHPLPGVIALAAITAGNGLLLLRLLHSMVPTTVASVMALLWVVLPTHMSTEVWITCSIIGASQLLALAALNLGLIHDRGPWHLAGAWALVAAAVLTYEATAPFVAVGVLLVPRLARGRIDWVYAIGSWVAALVAGVWIITHWFDGKTLQPWVDPTRVLEANFGIGVMPSGLADLSPVTAILGVCLLALAVARTGSRSLEATREDWWVIAGAAVMLIGFIPFVRYFYALLGAGDRVNYLSSVGGAVVWGGGIAMLARRSRRASAGVLVILVGVGLAARWERTQLWAAAGRDADAIAEATVAQIPRPDGVIVLGPEPLIRDNVVAYFDWTNFAGSLALAYDVPRVQVQITHDEAQFRAADPAYRIDVAEISELDDIDPWRRG